MSLLSRFKSLLPPGSEAAHPPSIHATSSCKRWNHPEFQICVSSAAIPAQDIAWFLDFLEQRVAAGERFRSGESLQVGWMYTTIQDGPDGMLRVQEPDMKTVPIKFVDSLDNTLKHVRAQRDIAASLTPAVSPEFPSLRQSAVVHVNYRTAECLLLSRFESDEMNSGWWISDLEDPSGSEDPTRFSKTSLYQLGVDRPDLIKFFALPTGLQVAIDKTGIGVLDHEGEVAQVPGSFLGELNRIRG